MDIFINEDARLAVKKGAYWLDENYPNWAYNINLIQLDMGECQNCVIGQAVGSYSETIRRASESNDYRAIADWAIVHGFEASQALVSERSYGYLDLDTLWSEEVKRRLG